jgi:pyridoxamine 5'-phosphate oxidase|tara:strand:+ start:4320 stop:4916 length:597 start_codon:yes stop_codon:yes gene_type:complete
MTKFVDIKNIDPIILFKEKYEDAKQADQKNIEAICISSFNKTKKEVDSRFVNLKFVDGDEFIFFSNYDSPKSKAFMSHSQISACIFWESINTQIRFKAKIKRTSVKFNKKYFKKRSSEKNILAISSNQSNEIASFKDVLEKYENVKNNYNNTECPDHWGGFSFKPYEIEFWEGNEFRLNKRTLYRFQEKSWHSLILEP